MSKPITTSEHLPERVFVQQQRSECAKLFESRMQEHLDFGDSVLHNYESFLEYSAVYGFDMPVDSNDYFDFRNDLYFWIQDTLEEYHSN